MNIPVPPRLSTCVALFLAAGLGGCSTPPRPLRELYTESWRPPESELELEESELEAYPLDASSHEAYVVIRRLDGVLEPFDELHEASGGAGKLVFPYLGEQERQVSVAYVGHAAFAHDFAVWHHLRLYLVNREPLPLRVELDDLALEAPSGPELMLATNRRRERVESTWVVEPGDSRTLHLFYRAENVDPALSFAFALRAPPGQGEGPSEVGPWLFAVELVRHFVIRDVELTDLERMVVLGETLPVAKPPPAPWAEPLLTPVPGAPAEGGGEAGGGEGAGG